jgi:uncharacterized protein (DUF2384 family)
MEHYTNAAAALGLTVAPGDDVDSLVHRGIYSTAISVLYGMGVTENEVRLYVRHPGAGTLTKQDSLGLLRLTHIVVLASERFRSHEIGLQWLRAEHVELDGPAPMAAAREEASMEIVERLISSIDESQAA